MHTQIDFMTEIAERNKELGMKASFEHAKRVDNGWYLSAVSLLVDFLRTNGERPFMAEDVRNYASLRGLNDPPSKRAWGAVMVRAAKAELIKAIGFGFTKNPLAHRTPATLWKVA